MGRSFHRRLIYTFICFLVVACIIYFNPSDNSFSVKEPLNLVFYDFAEWKPLHENELSEEVASSLSLDDYLFRSYNKNGKVVTLYIGYYRTADKIGAAHSPIVCLPGQGWEISSPKKLRIEVGEKIINSETIISNKGRQKELIVYWFQSDEKTSRGTFQQKINNFLSIMEGGGAENAFIRVSVPIENNNVEDSISTIENFIFDFYPHLLKYITQ